MELYYRRTIENALTFQRKDIKKIPHMSGCYVLFNAAGEVIYVGQAENVFKRVRSSIRKSAYAYDLKKTYEAQYIQCFAIDDETERHIIEMLLIDKLRPLYNIVGIAWSEEQRREYQKRVEYIQEFKNSLEHKKEGRD